MIGKKVTLVAALAMVAMVCCSCSSTGGADPNAQKVTPPDPSQLKQTGAGGVKARGGGGLAGLPQQAQPGEHVGAPGAGVKAAGGGN